MALFGMFKKKKHPLFSVVIVIAVVMVWRGLWGIFDHFFFPEHQLLSYTLSAGIGLAILYFTHYWYKELE